MTFSHNTCWRFLRCSDSLLSSFQWSRSFLCDMPHIPTVGESSFLQACFAVDSRRMICQELVFSGCNLDVLLIIFSSVAHDGLVLLKSLCFTFPHDLFQPAFTVKFMSQLLKAVPCWVLTTDTPLPLFQISPIRQAQLSHDATTLKLLDEQSTAQRPWGRSEST